MLLLKSPFGEKWIGIYGYDFKFQKNAKFFWRNYCFDNLLIIIFIDAVSVINGLTSMPAISKQIGYLPGDESLK
jgi:hypothetical protein